MFVDSLKILSIPIFFGVFSGCVTTPDQPYFETPVIAQQQLKLLDETVITVKVHDPYAIVNRVEGVVVEDTSGLRFKFHDDGLKGDEVAADSLWSVKVKVPYDGWAGTFTFVVNAYNAKGEAIIVRDDLNEVAPMTTTLNIDVKLPKLESETP